MLAAKRGARVGPYEIAISGMLYYHLTFMSGKSTISSRAGAAEKPNRRYYVSISLQCHRVCKGLLFLGLHDRPVALISKDLLDRPKWFFVAREKVYSGRDC